MTIQLPLDLLEQTLGGEYTPAGVNAETLACVVAGLRSTLQLLRAVSDVAWKRPYDDEGGDSCVSRELAGPEPDRVLLRVEELVRPD